MDFIRLSHLELSCIVGVRPAERKRAQRIRLSLELELDLARAGKSARIAHTVDYSVVADEVGYLLEFREYRLIEMATEEIAAMILGNHPLVERVRLTLEKPEALQGRAAHAAVCIVRERRDAPPVPRDFGDERILLETSEATLKLLSVEPGRRLDPKARPAGRALGWLVAGQLHADTPVAAYDSRELERVFGAENPGPERASVFVCA